MRKSSILIGLVFSLGWTVAGCGGGSGGNGGGGGGGGDSTTVTVKVGTAVTAAAQIGTGAFTPAAITSGIVTVSVPHGTSNFAVAAACPLQTVGLNGTQYTLIEENVLEASIADGTSLSLPCATAETITKGSLTGNVDASAIAGVNYVGVSAGNSTAGTDQMISGASSTFSAQMPAGTDRVALEGYVHATSSQLGVNSIFTLAAVRNFDGVAVPGSVNGGSTVALGAADAVTMEPITYSNVPNGYSAPITVANYFWANSVGGILLSNMATSQYPMVPAAAAESGDSYLFLSRADSATGFPPQSVLVDTWTTSGGPLTVTFPAAWTYAGPTPAALPVFTLAYSGFNGSSNVHYGVGVGWQPDKTTSVDRVVTATANYMGGSTSLAVPDLTAVTGFAAPPASGTLVEWSAEIGQSNFPVLRVGSSSSGTTSAVSSAGTYSTP